MTAVRRLDLVFEATPLAIVRLPADAPLAAAGIPIFALATFDTDWVLVPAAQAEAARVALSAAGHRLAAPEAAARPL